MRDIARIDISLTIATRKSLLTALSLADMTNAWPRTALFSFVVIGIVFIQFHSYPGREFNSDRSEEVWISTDGTAGPYSCPFRNYQNDSNRLYGLSSAPIYPESFLRRGFYIYGKPPILLPVVGTKVCSRSATSQMDGTNPSLVSVDRLRSFLSPNYSIPPQAKYLVSTTFKDVHQCNYEGVKRSRDEYPLIPGRQQRKEVDLLWLDSNFRNLQETHVWIAPNATVHYDADDVRIFTHGSSLWMTYKVFNEDEGMSRMGGSSQRLNRIEFEQRGKHLIATADPCNAIEICCGRNFGFVPPLKGDEKDLSSITFLTWPDPVWAQSVEMERLLGGNSFPANKPRYVEFQDPKVNKSHHPSPKNSHYHGTSNQLLYVQEWDEYLGVGHIHRNRRYVA